METFLGLGFHQPVAGRGSWAHFGKNSGFRGPPGDHWVDVKRGLGIDENPHSLRRLPLEGVPHRMR